MEDDGFDWIEAMLDSNWLQTRDGIIRLAAEALGEERFKNMVGIVLEQDPGICTLCVRVRALAVLESYSDGMREIFDEDITDEMIQEPDFDYTEYMRQRMMEDPRMNMRRWIHCAFRDDLRILYTVGRNDLAERVLGDIAETMVKEESYLALHAPDEVFEYSEWIFANKGCGDVDKALDWKEE
ncbi:MAG: hypothetical protein Q4Q58_03460 [Thermoplasmata archaeon]|nr:hypothetical protein [Thermoplasmata archaeon]